MDISFYKKDVFFIRPIIVVALLFFVLSISAQPSFQITTSHFDGDARGYQKFLCKSALDEKGHLQMLFAQSLRDTMVLASLHPTDKIAQGLRILGDYNGRKYIAGYYTGSPGKLSIIDENVFYSSDIFPQPYSSIICINKRNYTGWIRGDLELYNFSMPLNGNVFTVSGTDFLNLYLLDLESGNTLNKYGIKLFKTNNLQDPFNVGIFDGDSNGNFSVVSGSNHSFGNPGNHYVIKFNQGGFPDIWKAYFNEKLKPLGVGKSIYVSPDNFIYFMARYGPNSEGNEDLAIIKLDENLVPVWVKRYYADHFPFYLASMDFDNEGFPVLVYSTSGAFPVMMLKLDKDGSIISGTGSAHYSPFVEINSDGSYLITTPQNFDENGNVFLQSIIAKTDTLGNIDGCENYDVLLKTEDLSIVEEELGLDTFQIPDLLTGTVRVEPFQMEFTDICNFPPAPSPEFLTPDTICVGTCIKTDSIHSANAHAREWHLSGNDLELTQQDSLHFRYCFSQAGTYSLSQTIWFLGVAYTHERIIEVLPPLEANLDISGKICEDPPIDLSLQSNRSLVDFLWNTGDSTSQISVNSSGYYSARVSDGYCKTITSGNLDFVKERLNADSTILIEDELSVCEVNLPLTVQPTTAYLDHFENGQVSFEIEGLEKGNQFDIKQQGNYTIQALLDGCLFYKNVFVKVDECKAEVYVPSAFSPNNDGINDDFIPLGPDVESIELKIFDRWGNVLHANQKPWNGRTDSKPAPQGVYTFQFKYLNKKSGKAEQISGDVTLLR
jgi:gliding motility-associated-like protein